MGSAVVKGLLEAGFEVAEVDLPSAFQETTSSAADSGRHSENLLSLEADLTDEDSARHVLEKVVDRFGRPPNGLAYLAHYKGPRVLAPNSSFFANLEDYPIDEWNKVLEVNLTGLLVAVKVFGKEMAETGGGSIVTVASTYGVVGPDQSIYGSSGINSPVAYSAAKAGVIGFTRYLATYYGSKSVRANCLVPGGIEHENQTTDFQNRYKEKTPLRRMAKAEDYVGPIRFLLSAESSYMTGSLMVVDGGWTAQ